ncbi:putative tripartite motif-containing protein 75 [Mirounga leonina]|uniref:putative tripartite motif-containing protein 75 n=1 Tax=Mirounga leonina TaxID=9715 RepID=UPI00156BEC77|nr:putative tripartite motif-containing protein 75 [Mirounga leonina]
MAVPAALAGLQAEANCPICLDYLRDPVTTECGHNFCRCCIQQSWADRKDRLPCPVCRHTCRERHLRSNTQLGRMIDIAKLLHVTRSKKRRPEERHCCEKHNQVLTLFCEEDLEVLCPKCTQPPGHQGHQVRPLEEAASHHRQRLSRYIRPLKKRVADVPKLVATQERELSDLREKVQYQRQKVTSEFEHLHERVDREQEAVLSRLAEEERDLQQKVCANSTARRPQSTFPPSRAYRLRREECSLPPQDLALEKTVQKFRREVTLDPDTAHPHLLASEGKKSVTFVRKKPGVPQNPRRLLIGAVVLGSEGLDGGRHSWGVQVGGKRRRKDNCRETILSGSVMFLHGNKALTAAHYMFKDVFMGNSFGR